MSEASSIILEHVIIPNLVWRVGKVEATIRKVALAICYGIFKAGAVTKETLFNSAKLLVPLIVSHLDDTELSPRLMSCYCLQILFTRLQNCFSDQAVHEIYPKLLKRLDDSNDEVRLAICKTLQAFFQSSPKEHFKGTLIDYSLDQLFIHLDDPDIVIQNEIYTTILSTKELVTKDAMLNKIDKNIITHRTPTQCEKLKVIIQGYEILS